MLSTLPYEFIREKSRQNLENLELWLKRLLNEKLTTHFGTDYIHYQFSHGGFLFKKEIREYVEKKFETEPSRFHNHIDTFLLDHLIYTLCKQDIYDLGVGDIFKESYKTSSVLHDSLFTLIEPRNKLSHANLKLSHLEIYRILFHTSQIISCIQIYYVKAGKEKMYNVPQILHITSSTGEKKDFPEERSSKYFTLKENWDNNVFFPGDTIRLDIAVSPEFSDDSYMILWKRSLFEKPNEHNTKSYFSYTFTEMDIKETFIISVSLVSNKKWHKHGSYDDKLDIFMSVAPNEN